MNDRLIWTLAGRNPDPRDIELVLLMTIYVAIVSILCYASLTVVQSRFVTYAEELMLTFETYLPCRSDSVPLFLYKITCSIVIILRRQCSKDWVCIFPPILYATRQQYLHLENWFYAGCIPTIPHYNTPLLFCSLNPGHGF